ncbi:MAG: hypothetical protein Q4G22_07275 [Paracoccus sp. (in: a-proteobacteria)]|uniref:hypothetical protein n=1 Tax=Paracoccus sp. TaxID=267 RepID=UPI0026DEA756|nr:hypothetical protein [Paracoccus sp. (in: a-proteobacteria)]MDO5631623.1 hypothetical protein [Paracoccus sp. (in: a-proteobacteria)]
MTSSRSIQPRVALYINGPEEVMGAFIEFREQCGHTSYWQALEDLLERCGRLATNTPADVSSPDRYPAFSTRKFSYHPGQVKERAKEGPVILTEQRRPAYVLMTYRDFVDLMAEKETD